MGECGAATERGGYRDEANGDEGDDDDDWKRKKKGADEDGTATVFYKRTAVGGEEAKGVKKTRAFWVPMNSD